MAGHGRPKLPPGMRRDTDIKIPLNADEKNEIVEGASADGEKPVTWARDVLLTAAKRRKKKAA